MQSSRPFSTSASAPTSSRRLKVPSQALALAIDLPVGAAGHGVFHLVRSTPTTRPSTGDQILPSPIPALYDRAAAECKRNHAVAAGLEDGEMLPAAKRRNVQNDAGAGWRGTIFEFCALSPSGQGDSMPAASISCCCDVSERDVPECLAAVIFRSWACL